MYFPSDPIKTPALWDTFKESLQASNASYILENGQTQPANFPRKVTSVEASNLVSRLREMEYVRIGTSRLMAIPPHFGVVLNSDRTTAELVEYLALEYTNERIERDISLLVDLIFYELPNLQKLAVPLDVGAVVITGIKANIGDKRGVTEFIRSSEG
ncbi:hypothetical protein [Collimonas humicola]|uniref:hypothetical protein n=1 Tax=Collimonas humicola TaxID=2825886 RepID=UPI001B8CB78B|nr:hypothetical protein [Collimonas humicola]